MARGTWIYYQGVPCFSVSFRRSRGYAADLSQVVVPADGFPSLDLGDPAERRPVAPVSIAQQQGPAPTPKGPRADGGGIQLRQEGTLVLSSGDGPGQTVVIPGLYVIRADTARVDGNGRATQVLLTLADVRYFGARGALRRWRFNDMLPGGDLDLSTVKPDGSLYTQGDVAASVVSDLFGALDLVAHPAPWASNRKGARFAPFAPAGLALRAVVEQGGAAEPCLRIGGGLALHEPGDGRVGYAREPDGSNEGDLPPGVFLDADGRGQGYGLEPGYPEKYVVVVGGPTVATVALDDWEPVLTINGRPFFLGEELVRQLTDGRFGLTWLKRVVMAPNAFQGIDIDPSIADLFRTQAYRMFRMPGVELIEGGFYTGEPGPNAHMLPILDRAETSGGRRVGPTVETYRWELRHRKARGVSSSGQQLLLAQTALQDLSKQATSLALKQRVANPLGQAIRPEDFLEGGSNTEAVNALEFVSALEFTKGLSPSVPSLDSLLKQARRVELLGRNVSGALGSAYADALTQKHEASDAADGGVKALTWKLAQALVALELEALQARDVFDAFSPLAEKVERLRPQINQLLQQYQRDVAAKRQADEIAEATGQDPEVDQITLARFTLNLARNPDPRASVHSAEAGVVATSELAGHTAEVVANPGTTSLVPCPVRVVFGAELRPRVDVAGDAPRAVRPPQTSTGPADEAPAAPPPAQPVPAEQTTTRRREQEQQATTHAGCGGGDNVLPEVLTDQASYFTAAFRRVARGRAEEVPVEAVPLDQVVPLEVPWQRLVPFVGDGNHALLRIDAAELARKVFLTPDKVEGYQRQLAGAWPVQCDGLIESMEIVSRDVQGAPCGFVTTISVGGVSAPVGIGRTRTRTP